VYRLLLIILNKTRDVRDLEVIVTDHFKVGKQCLMATKKANLMLGMIRRTFVSH